MHLGEGAGKRAGGRAEPSVGREGGWEGRSECLLGGLRGGDASARRMRMMRGGHIHAYIHA